MGHFRSNLFDVEFTLFEVLGLDRVLGVGVYAELDVATVREMLAEVTRLAEGPIAASFADGDRHPPTFDPTTHSVLLPASFKESVRAFLERGWDKIGIAEDLGGVPVPRALVWALHEQILGANPAVTMYCLGGGFGHIFASLATDEQRAWARIAVDRGWGSSMVLTEPDAGSDVGAARTKAAAQDDGSWHIDGVKRFITSADSDDLFENIFHLVLARPEGAVLGTKGLSLFFVPKYLFDARTGELGERNGVFVTNIEHKMGLKVSATCELSFGRHGVPATGWLVGEVHDGIAQMFDVIEQARMMVGTKAIATLSTGYLNALDYAKTRIQGADLTQMTDKTAPRVSITRHPDVRRSLMTQKTYAEGLRALYLYAATFQGNDGVAEALHGVDAALAVKVNDLLLPVVKGVGSEQAYAKLTESLQTFGGSGFLQDYPIEQYIRDAKIDSLYEGTTAIQAQDFFFRKIVRDKGVALAYVAGQVEGFDDEVGNSRLEVERKLLATALADVKSMAASLTGYLMAAQDDVSSLYKVGLGSVRFLMSVGDLPIGWLLLRQAAVAIRILEGGTSDEPSAYEGKIVGASFFVKNFLPLLTGTRAVIENLDNAIMELDEAAF